MSRDGAEQEPVNETDTPAEVPDPGTEVGDGSGSVQDLPDEQGASTPERDELAERTLDLQRVTAEYANYRRRVARDKQVDIENAKASVLTELLGVLDDLDRARQHGDLDSGPLRGVADKLEGVFTAQGVAAFGAEGDAFDPALHEAVQHEGDGHAPVIGSVYRKGYTLRERVLRTAMVVVVDGPDAAGAPADEQDGSDRGE